MHMKFIAGLEMQPNFPYEDLSDVNADLLELMLANHEFVMTGHREAERYANMFRCAHSAIQQGADRLYDDPERIAAISHGVAVLEAASSMVGALPSGREYDITSQSVAIASVLREPDLHKYISDATELLREETPRLAELSRTVSRRFYRHLATYAELGTAIERQFVLDTTSE